MIGFPGARPQAQDAGRARTAAGVAKSTRNPLYPGVARKKMGMVKIFFFECSFGLAKPVLEIEETNGPRHDTRHRAPPMNGRMFEFMGQALSMYLG